MGNQLATCQHPPMPDVGLMIAECGCADMVGFDNSVKAIMSVGGIEPWSAKDLVQANLERQCELAKVSPLQYVHVADGLRLFREHISSFDGRLSKLEFLKTCRKLFTTTHIEGVSGTSHEKILEDVYDSMDFDGDQMLSRGEWAGGLCVFFKGTDAEKVHAVFALLDNDQNGALSRAEFKDFLAPYVKAMTPPKAAMLRPLLLKRATDDIFRDIDVNVDTTISSDEMNRWLGAGNNVVGSLCKVIESEVYAIWLQQQQQRMQPMRMA